MPSRKPKEQPGREVVSRPCRAHGSRKVGPNSQADVLRRLDGRGTIARRMKAIKAELMAAMNGEVTPQRQMLINIASLRAIRIEALLPQMVTCELPAEEAERRLAWHMNGLRNDLLALGLDRPQKAPPSLADYLAEAQRRGGAA